MVVLVGLLVLRVTASAETGCGPAAASGDLRLAVERRADNALIADARVQVAEPAAVYLEYGSDQLGWLRTPTSAPATGHQIPLVRLRAQTSYQVRAFAVDEAGCPVSGARGEVTTDRLPAELQTYKVSASGQASFPLVLMDWGTLSVGPGVNGEDRSRWLVAFDQDQEVVWYYQLPREFSAFQNSIIVVRRSNGDWLYLSREYGFEEVTPDARAVWQLPLSQISASPHHDFLERPDGRILFLGREGQRVEDPETGEAVRVRTDTLNLLDPQSGMVRRVWRASRSLDLSNRPEHWQNVTEDDGKDDWTHGNSVFIGPRGNVVVSFRHLDQIVSISPDFSTVEWRLGGPNSSFDLPDESDRFYGQHGVSQLPNGDILLFDNGNFRPEGDYSRALELQLDFSTMTARKVWEYRHDPDVFSNRVSNAIRLPNGNTLVNFGFRADDPAAPVVLVEARPDGTAAWTQLLSLDRARASRYRAYALTSLAGEQSVEPTRVAGGSQRRD